jgi:hypothetical protein
MVYPDKYLEYYICAKEFGWTPDQVDNTPADKFAWILAINEIVAEVNGDGSK